VEELVLKDGNICQGKSKQSTLTNRLEYKIRQRYEKMIYNRFKNKWQNKWLKMNTKLNKIKRTPEKWNNPMSLKIRNKVVLNRTRIGHTHYIHAHVKKEPPRTCPTSIKHIITEFRDTQEAQQKYSIPHLHNALGPDEESIKNIKLYNSV